MVNILILGYYNRQNWGDDVFEHVFKHYIFNDQSKFNLKFKNLDDFELNTKEYQNIDKVIIGGGDIINEYFFNEKKINLFRQFFNNKPIYFVGIGLTYPNLINIMDIGDYFFMRNSTDYKYAKNRYSDEYSYKIPDIAFNLLNEPSINTFNKPKSNDLINKIGIVLPGTWLEIDKGKEDSIIVKMSDLINNLVEKGNEVHLIPFDTTLKHNNSDILLMQAIQNEMKKYPLANNVNYLYPLKKGDSYSSISINDMIEYFKSLDIMICGRFHSTILSIITNTPFVSIYSTPKLENLKKDLSGFDNFFIKLDKDFDKISVIEAINHVKENYSHIVEKLELNTELLNQDTCKFNKYLNDLISSEDTVMTFRQSPPQYISDIDKNNLINTTISNVLKQIFNKISINNINLILKGRPILDILPRVKPKNLDSLRQALTEEILWNITGDPYAPYYYGLYDNIFNSSFKSQLEWIISDYYENYFYKQSKNNVTIINKNFQKLHRSGWQYIVNNIVTHLDKNLTGSLIVDTYIDKTFHWNKTFYKTKNIIPYINPWIGFIHHTYSDYNNNYNCLELFKDSIFIESLQSCKALIVMTQYLSKQIKESLKKLNLNHIKVHTIIHPTENSDIVFTWDNFMNNNNKQIVQIGNWLRDVFGIYRVFLPNNSIIKEKVVLKNRNSDNYFPPDNFLNNLYLQLNSENPKNSSVDICRNSFKNMYIKGLYNCIEEMENSVTIKEFLDNDSYDELLSKNIVFLHLMDASACNTLIECVVRNTPIIVNPIPPVVEILGKDYPLYYNNYYEVSKLLEDSEKIKEAYNYLCNMSKDALDINTFIQELTNIIQEYTK